MSLAIWLQLRVRDSQHWFGKWLGWCLTAPNHYIYITWSSTMTPYGGSRSQVSKTNVCFCYCKLLTPYRCYCSRELWNPLSNAVPGKFHGSSGHSKRNYVQDRANCHRSRAWHIVLIFTLRLWNTSVHKFVFAENECECDRPHVYYTYGLAIGGPLPSDGTVVGFVAELKVVWCTTGHETFLCKRHHAPQWG